MQFSRFFLCLLSVPAAIAFDGRLLKHLTEPKPGGIIDAIRNPKIPGLQLGGGLSFGIGSFGLNLGFNKQYTPHGTGVLLPPKDPLPESPDTDSYVPGAKPGFPNIPSNPVVNPYVPAVKPGYWNPYVPDGGNPHVPGYPGGNPYIPGHPGGNPYPPAVKPEVPEKPEVSWEEEEDKEEKKSSYYPPRPNWSKEEEKPEAYQEDVDSHEDRKDTLPDWEDIGEADKKAENFMNGDLVGGGHIQPRRKNRSKRYIESRVFHVPLIFQSNAKPYQVKIQSHLNGLAE